MQRFFCIALIILAGCTQNQSAKKYGGTMNVKTEKGRKVLNVTWKDDSLWILTRPTKTNEKPETVIFQEESAYGFIEGKVVITEQ
jgi:hypothetical protein